ncbi:MAG: phosphonate C-P lyase system protein PhnL [Xanthobacteraceae bacterium]
MPVALELNGVAKTFTMHLQGGVRLAVVSGVEFAVRSGECLVLTGPSGAGKSSILKMIFGSYHCDRGRILLRQGADRIDVAAASPRQILAARRRTIGYVSQFLRAVPRVATIDVVAEPLVATGMSRDQARGRAAKLLGRLNIPAPLWGLFPATFSGGEQQRVNIARGFLPDLPILLLDEPTASLDTVNTEVVLDLIAARKRRGTAIVAVVHDSGIRDRIADDVIDITRFTAAA